MSETLYRKYRPLKWSEVLGQEHVVSVLKGAVAGETYAHAYLFSGGRGLGKTTLARILAKELGTDAMDLYEIDGASNRGIDEIRELREASQVLPFKSKHKVYIIDEIHMLTTPAFNAFLKVLEEPPKHALFLMATTEPQKLPGTIISRCQHLTLKKPSEEILAKMVVKTSAAEGSELTKDAAELVAILGEGSFRDTLGVLQKVLSMAKGKKIEEDEVAEITGTPKRELTRKIIEAVAEGKTGEALSVITQCKNNNLDMKILTKMLIRDLRLAMLYVFAANKNVFKKDGEEHEYLERVSKLPKVAKILPGMLREVLTAYSEIGSAAVPELPLELAIVGISQAAIAS